MNQALVAEYFDHKDGYFKDLELADLVGTMAREKYHGQYAHH